jgi:predicted TIM-barrel fold metal-dependent hydrolase
LSGSVAEVLTARHQALFERHVAAARALLPDDLRIWDAHTHLGLDEDGFSQDVGPQLDAMREHGIKRAFTFALNDPDRAPAYRTPNDRVLAWAAESGGMLVPFCRLDMSDGPLDEARRCLALGARGIKLHPRAQGFDFDEAALRPVFELAAELRVPILIHAGRGLPPIAEQLQHLVELHPQAQLILAHAAIADLEHIARVLTDHPNVVYDTSVWSTTDLRALLAAVAPEQILFASDTPYGTHPLGIVQLAQALHAAGASRAITAAIFWDNAERVAEGRPAAALSPPLLAGAGELSYQRLRVIEYLAMAVALVWLQQDDTPGAISLARAACDPGSDDGLHDAAELIEAAGELWDEDQRDCFHMIQLAQSLVLSV